MVLAFQAGWTVTAGHNGNFLSPKAKRDCEMQGLCQGAVLPNLRGREGLQGLPKWVPRD
jgi:hypothetical protein